MAVDYTPGRHAAGRRCGQNLVGVAKQAIRQTLCSQSPVSMTAKATGGGGDLSDRSCTGTTPTTTTTTSGNKKIGTYHSSGSDADDGPRPHEPGVHLRRAPNNHHLRTSPEEDIRERADRPGAAGSSLNLSLGRDPRLALDLPTERQWYRNRMSSCAVLHRMCGVDQNVPQVATLLWDSEWSQERGGSGPTAWRPTAKRGTALASPASTLDDGRRNGRCAIGAGRPTSRLSWGSLAASTTSATTTPRRDRANTRRASVAPPRRAVDRRPRYPPIQPARVSMVVQQLNERNDRMPSVFSVSQPFWRFRPK